MFLACSQRDTSQISNSGEFNAYLSIAENEEGYGIWVVNIVDIQSDECYSSEMENYPGSLMAYIAWDEGERLWFYSSDDGSYFYWEADEENWEMKSPESSTFTEDTPPSELLDQMDGSRRN